MKDPRPQRPPAATGLQVLTTLLSPAPGKGEELLQTLRALRAEIGGQAGCRACVVCRDVDGGDQLVLVTAWESPAALEAHRASEPFRVLSGASQLLGAPGDLGLAPPLTAPAPAAAPA